MRVSIMIEGAWGLNWERWKRLVLAAEGLGFDGIYRSDHFMSKPVPRLDALEPMISLAWVADNTKRIEFGTLVSPISFRDPRILAWEATAINSLAEGRLRLGLGAGWQELEHQTFGFELQPLPERFDRMEEGVQIVRGLTRSDEPFTFEGKYFQLKEAQIPPRWPASDSPAIIIGGSGPKRTLPLVAKYADEWNALKGSLAEFRERNALLDELLEKEKRGPDSVRRSQMSRCIIEATQSELDAHPEAAEFDAMRDAGEIVGTPEQVVSILAAKAEAGVESVMLQWLEMDNIAGLELFANSVLPHVQG